MEAVTQAVNKVAEAVVGQPAVDIPKPREPEDWLKADEVEEVKPDEDAKITEIGKLVHSMIDHNFDAHQHKFRGTHVKSLAFVKGTLTVSSSLPPHLQQGLFAQSGASYPVIARYANEPSFLLPDTTRAPRGLSFKVFGVPGERLSEDGLETQDFLMNNDPMIELTDVDTALEIFKLRVDNFDSPLKLQAAYAMRSDRMKQFAPGMLPLNYVIGESFYTQSAFSFGPYVAHFSLIPASPAQEPYKAKTIPSDAGSTFHRDSLREYYSSESSTYTLRAQFSSDITKQPVEDASIVWDETSSPWHELATLTFPTQDTFSNQRRVWWEDHIALSPWSGLKAHRPLGSINRLRKRVYEMSRAHRKEGNQVEVLFPKSADEMPA